MLQATKPLLWQSLTLDLQERIRDISWREGARSVDFAFENMYLWDESYRQQVAFFEDRLLVKIGRCGSNYYVCPIGQGPLGPAVEAMREDAHRCCGTALTVSGVTAPYLAAFNETFPDAFDVRVDRDYFDYLYTAESLATLAGKKLHGKRNHINAFCAKYPSWRFRPLTVSDFPLCEAILDQWAEAHREGGSADTVNAERRAIERGFAAWNALSLVGGLLTVDDQAVAFTVGEKISRDTFCVHFEKTLPAWQEAYPVINRELVRYLRDRDPTITFINREDDMGLENLRRSKESYRPIELVEKYTLIFRE